MCKYVGAVQEEQQVLRHVQSWRRVLLLGLEAGPPAWSGPCTPCCPISSDTHEGQHILILKIRGFVCVTDDAVTLNLLQEATSAHLLLKPH